ncbi:hypothetical protein AOA12_11895 [Microbacterium sp. No. 7]|nr:hypothetical protein AOA12_11895 [Microbacterium sp. No. 7]
MEPVRDDEEVTGRSVPRQVSESEQDAALEDLQGCLSGAFVLSQAFAGLESNKRLSELMLVSSEDGLRASTTGRFLRLREFVSREGDE